jgi:hypothetical protein
VNLPIDSVVDLSIVFCMFTRGYYKQTSTENGTAFGSIYQGKFYAVKTQGFSAPKNESPMSQDPITSH